MLCPLGLTCPFNVSIAFRIIGVKIMTPNSPSMSRRKNIEGLRWKGPTTITYARVSAVQITHLQFILSMSTSQQAEPRRCPSCEPKDDCLM